jgi:hypothetical protein
MIFLCNIGIHSWNNCQCTRCWKIRDKGHSWNLCKCSICGLWRDENHTWDGCICSNCGRERNSEHDWSKNCEICSKCNKRSGTPHSWNGCKCSVCGQIRNQDHSWELTGNLKKCSQCLKWELADRSFTQVELAEIAYDLSNNAILDGCLAALEQMTDQSLLMQVAMLSKTVKIQDGAIRKMTDKSHLKAIAELSLPNLSHEAGKRLADIADYNILIKLANDNHPIVSSNAQHKILSKMTLKEIHANPRPWS